VLGIFVLYSKSNYLKVVTKEKIYKGRYSIIFMTTTDQRMKELKRKAMGFFGWKTAKTQEEMSQMLIETGFIENEKDAQGVLEKLMGRRIPQASEKPISQELPYAKDFLGSYSLVIEPDPDNRYIIYKINTDY